MLQRALLARRVDQVVVATSKFKEDDPIACLCADLDVPTFRGALDDVLDRYYQAAKPRAPAHVVRLTADCPLIDWRVIDSVVNLHLDGGHDYSSNILERTFPQGLDVEILTFAALETAWRAAELPPEREHVTLFVRDRPDLFRLGSLTRSPNLAEHRWTVDYPEDHALVGAVYEALYPQNPAFTTEDVLDFIAAHPEIRSLNAGIDAAEGARPSSQSEPPAMGNKSSNRVG